MTANEKEIINFDRETQYELGGVKYMVISYFDQNAENMMSKMIRILKSDIKNLVYWND